MFSTMNVLKEGSLSGSFFVDTFQKMRSLVGPGVGIPFGCQIDAKDVQCAFDARKAVSTWDGNSAFNTEPRQDTFSGVSDRAPRLLRYYVWGYGRSTSLLLWRGQRVGWSATSVKQGDPAGPLYFAVGT